LRPAGGLPGIRRRRRVGQVPVSRGLAARRRVHRAGALRRAGPQGRGRRPPQPGGHPARRRRPGLAAALDH